MSGKKRKDKHRGNHKLLEVLKELSQNDKVCEEACSKYIRLSTIEDSDMENILSILAGLLLSQDHTLTIADHLSDSLPQILALALSDDSPKTPLLKNVATKLLHEKRCVALFKLALVHPDVIMFALKYFNGNPSPFHYWNADTDDEPKAKKRRIHSSSLVTPVSDEEIAVCCYSFLKMKTDHFRGLWDWSQFLKVYLNHKESFVRWLACQCCALLLKMGVQEKENLLVSKLNSTDIVDFPVKYCNEERRIKEKYAKICFGKYSSDIDSTLPQFKSDAVTSVAGIVLPLNAKVSCNLKSNLVLVNSTLSNLQAIALGIATGRTLCLQGPVGCGKTALVEHLANLTGRGSPPHYLSVQLGDQTDSKMLLGTYQCTDIPGEFVWKAGVLTQAVVGGYWLLLEDIDSCTTDVAAVLSSLLETGTLCVPGFKDCVYAAPGFQLFFTQRLITGATGLHKQHTGVTSMLQRHWLTVQMEPLSESELVEVVRTLHPTLSTVAPRIVDVFLLFSAGSHHTALLGNEGNSDQQIKTVRIQSAGARLPSTRDLIKWCTRSSEAFDVSSPESALKLFQDGVDIFCCNVSNPETRLTLAESIAAKLGIIHTKATYLCNIHKPIISSSSSHVVAGRIKLPRKEADKAVLGLPVKSTYSFTRPAAALLERIASCIYHNEPVLLVGETGVGKTSSIQYLARQMGQSMSVINMNQQSDSADLLGGFKPVELKYVISPLRDEFETLFRKYFSVDKNTQFLSNIERCFASKKWTALLALMKHSTAAALKQFETVQVNPKSSRKSQTSEVGLRKEWLQLSKKLHKVQEQLKKSQNALAFAFVEGTLVKALQEGQWVLLDEINLASAQTLECLSSLLEGSTGSLYLLERGDENSISRHSNFRIFAAMNPATDVGKKDLPPGIRNRFTEFYVDELVDHQDLILLTGTYLAPLALPASKLEALVKFYLKVCQEAVSSLSDGTGHKPHYSLRTLCRALTVAASNPCASTPRSLYEGFLLSFLTQLDRSSHPIVEDMVAKAVMGKNASNPKSIIKQPIPDPTIPGKSFVEVEGYWVTQGSLEPQSPDKYIMTKTVRQNLRDLVRVVSLARLPVLLQGETSVGKTSLITYLAQLSGNRCLRINNHEHTDLQEYIGCYAADEHGNLVFKEGVLVEAMRYGHWIILDELNLAPSDVLEALNRVLDDNRELFIPETQIVVKAHPNFMLFATQNPPGLYGGRKVLSRAFRNRFIELHFDEIPGLELETIMHLRCDMPPSYCKKMVAVMTDLQVRRRGSAAFAGKQGFITLRDLFRWGERYRLAQHVEQGKFYDWDQHIADEGYLILAGRVRKEDERVIIQEVLKKHIKRFVDPEKLFSLNNETAPVTRAILESFIQQAPSGFGHIVWTFNMRRLAVLLGKACQFKEPILLVGETGCGKTTVCQLLAAIRNQNLASVNCHMHSESADFLGGLRPVREHSEEKKGKLFEWVDGPLIEAMLNGGVFLADEISLADDSVLERLNSLLEPERKLLLAEKGSGLDGQPCEVAATDGFIFVGTMNPGGDYGKKELSPALRNRFTEIWCEGCTQRSDLIAVIEHNLRPELVFTDGQNDSYSVGLALVDFLEWFAQTDLGSRLARSIRDIMTWVEFINICTEASVNIDLSSSYIHGACLTFLDSLGTGMTSFSTRESVYSVRVAALEFLRKQIKKATGCEPASLKTYLTLESDNFEVLLSAEKFGMKPFYVSRGCSDLVQDTDFLLSAPTTRINAMRVLRGLQLGKALLLEGSPGVGKTSLVAALAHSAGYKLTRINLSDQTDVSDLFGADLPVEGGSGGEFAWRDGPFLQALRAGHWILLDELNLASQSVLEGLNAVLDHRGDLFIPELGRTFHIQPGRTRLFACQNPLNQGGARKGLPQSFLNRFTQVYMETLTFADLEYICKELYPTLPSELIKAMVKFNLSAASETAPGGKWGQRGSPWEMNLRDLCRWCEVTVWGSSNGTLNPGRFVHLIYVDRMRTVRDKEEMMALYNMSFSDEYPLICDVPQLHITPSTLYVGDVSLKRGHNGNASLSKLVLRHQLPTLQSLARCVSMGWLSILVGPAGCGKTSLVHLLAQLAGKELRTLAVNSAMDTTEILGGFEQADYKRHLDELASKVEKIMTKGVQYLTLLKKETESQCLLSLWEAFLHSASQILIDQVKSVESEIKFFSHQIDSLTGVLQAIPENSVTSGELQEKKSLLDKLSQLKDCAIRDSSLNAGGKFEWVDSILIKSLTDGCWLLVDNVNLCSAAVLDRLNGLLEPQGVLTVSERGVNSNGELVTIRPHPDFRLFLTMDPRNGEISRAMRNRGVEIYVTTGEGDMTASLSQLDLSALLYDVGICSHYDQQLVLSLHRAMVDVIQGPDPPGLTELLHASYLFVQQVQRGMPSVPSLLSSFTKVYIQSRVCDNIDIKRRNLTILEETVRQRVPDCSKGSALDKLVSECTLNTGEIYLDSCLATVRQRSAILSALADSDELDLHKVFQSLGITDTEVDFQLLLTDLIILFYQTCSVSDANLAHKWLQKTIEGSSHGEVIGQVSDILYGTLVNVDDLAKCHLIWDRRWLPDVRSAIAALSGMDDQGVENRVSLLLYITAHALRNKLSFNLSSMTKRKNISVLEYSHAVSKGALADTLSSEPVFVEIGPFLDVAFDILNTALNSFGVTVSDDLWWLVRKAYTWTQRFLQQAASLHLSSDKNAAAEALNLLAAHYRWFSKYSLPILIHLASEAALDISSFRETIGRLDDSVFTNNSVLWRVAKRLRSVMGQPLPMASELQAMLSMRALSISNMLNMWYAESQKGKFTQLLNFLSTSEGLLARASLIVAWRDLFATSDLSKVEERLQQAEKIGSELGVLKPHSNVELDTEPTKHQRNLQTLLWPFQEAVCLHASNSVLLMLLQGQCQEKSSFIQAMKTTPSIPAAFIGFFEAIQMEEKSQELCQGITWLFKFSNQSLAVSNTQLWTPSELNTDDGVGESEGSLPQHCPILSRLAANLLFCHNPSSKEQLYSSALDQHSDHAKLLRSLHALLWKKSEDFCNPEHYYRENETKSVLAAAEHFLVSLEKSCYLVSEELVSFQERADAVIEELQNRLGNKASSLSDFYTMLVELVNVLNTVQNNQPLENEILILVGLSWTLLGCLESQLFSAFPKIDPTVKHAIKRQHIKEEIVATKAELVAAKMIGAVRGVHTDCTPSHPHLTSLKTHMVSLEKQFDALSHQVAVRPEPPLYSTLTKEMQHFANSLGSSGVVTKLTHRLRSVSKMTIADCQAVTREAQTWLQSARSFTTMLETRFGLWYPDIVGPLLASSAKLVRGIELMVGVCKKIYLNGPNGPYHSTLSKLVNSLGSFPTLSSDQPSVMTLLSHIANRHSPYILEQTLRALVGETPDLLERSQTEAFWMLKSAVLELKNFMCVTQSCKSEEWSALVKIFRSFTHIWEKQEAERREREEDKESLYKSRGAVRCQTVNEEEESLREMAEIFPSKRENDFGDLEPQNTLDDAPNKPADSANTSTLKVMINDEDVTLVSSVHMSLVLAYTKSPWIDSHSNRTVDITPDFLSPWLQRCAVAARLISSCSYILDDNVDRCLLPSWILASHVSLPKSELYCSGTGTSPEDPLFDFYRTPCIGEVKQCKPLLDSLQKKIDELLSEWPEHPTLNQIGVVIKRIVSFPVESPIARFLTGLEILLTKMREWEENAHKGVSLARHSTAITHMVIQWRRLELSVWKNCLNAAALRMQSKASRWWFYIFSLVDTFIHPSPEKESMNEKEIVTSLERFMEEAPLGEFHMRLDMILAFHCHVINLPGSDQQRELQSILWNLHNFYTQFKEMVANRITELKAPIEKKLKDYVKIARWNDINYWAVKESVFKTQRVLHKHIKEFESVLRQAARSTLLSSRIEGQSHSRKNIQQLNPQAYIAKVDGKHFLQDTSGIITNLDQPSVVSRAGSLFRRSKKLTKDIILSSVCPGLIAALDEFSNQIAASVQELAAMEVDRTLPKPKQKSQAKNQLQVKRKALADLFRVLRQNVGLSHYTGLTYEEINLKHEFIQLPPIDLCVYLQSLSKATDSTVSNKADKEMLSAWNGCSPYFMRAWARYIQLSLALRSPHRELGPQNIERLRGFPAHLLVLTQDQHKQVYKNTNQLVQMRIHLFQLKSLQEFLGDCVPSQPHLGKWNQRLQSLLVSSSVTLQQFKLLLDACPDADNSQDLEKSIPVIVHEGTSHGLASLVKGDLTWQKTVEIVDQALSVLTRCRQQVNTQLSDLLPGHQPFATADHFKMMSQCYEDISALADNLSKLEDLFGTESCFHPATHSLIWLKQHMLSECKGFSDMCQGRTACSHASKQSVPLFDDIANKVNSLMQNILLAIQKMYKSHTNFDDPTSDQTEDQTEDENVLKKGKEDEETEEDDIDLQEKHLSDGILKSVESDFINLSVLEISSSLDGLMNDLLTIINEGKSSVMEKSIRMVLHISPLLQQWLLLYQFVVQQQVAAYRASSKLLSILLAVFGDVTVKGFCTPEDVLTEEEAGDGDGQSDSKQDGSMGLGDGEGEKNVSDRIESEDQLEDARPAGEEKKNEDKDCKEEEDGIEMSDNFDGKLQDVEPKGDDDDEEDNDDDNDDEDAEKEMGDTEKNADQLDEQIWGSDSEEEEGDEGDGKDEEDGNSGEKSGEKEFGARENEKSKSNENDDDHDENGEEQKQEKNKPEINEMKDAEEDDDQVDPYHGNHPPEIEPEPLDLPDDLQLDDGEGKDNEETNEENPFDIDGMKDKLPLEPDEVVEPEDNSEESKDESEQTKAEDEASDDDDFDADPKNDNEEGFEEQNPEDVEENPENADERKDGQKLEDIEEEENADEKENENEQTDRDERTPSKDDPTSEPTQAAEDVHKGSMDQVASNPQESQETTGEQPPEEADGDPGGEERDAIGQAPTNEELKGHHSDRSGKRPQRDQQKRETEEEKQSRPGHSDEQRSLGDISEPAKKRLKTIDMKQTEEEEDGAQPQENPEDDDTTADLYQHIKDVKEQSTTQTIDAATKEQAEQQPVIANEEEEDAPPPDDEDVAMDIDNEDVPPENVDSEKQKEEKLGGSKNEKKKEQGKVPLQNEDEAQEGIEVDGETVETLGMSRGPETTFHTRFDDLVLPNIITIAEMEEQSETVRKELENQLASWNVEHAGEEATQAWQSLSTLTNSLARDLSEQLRLVLEPTQATRMKGDFRTGRRINMRKVIPYIASQFRKDKIWMRRTKPSKREYQIVLAIDDSSSMADNRSKELAFESLALVSQALTLLEAGELGVVSFGEAVKVLHKLGEPFTQHSGARLLQQFTFEQKKTHIGLLVEFANALFTTSKTHSSAEHAQLLVVISDGRGVFSEGQEKVNSCVRKARLAGIFMVFVIIDNPENKNSILDIRTPIFSGGQLLGISSYMDTFPFPFYLILRDIANLPAVLSDALRQWFEIVSGVE